MNLLYDIKSLHMLMYYSLFLFNRALKMIKISHENTENTT